MLSLGRADRISLGILVGVTAVGLAFVPRLPEEVAIHFTASGMPDNYVSRVVAVFSGPVIILATIVIVRGAARLDPPNDYRSVDTVVIGMTGLLSVIYLLVLGWNIGYAVPMSLVVIGALLWTVTLAGYVILRETTP